MYLEIQTGIIFCSFVILIWFFWKRAKFRKKRSNGQVYLFSGFQVTFSHIMPDPYLIFRTLAKMAQVMVGTYHGFAEHLSRCHPIPACTFLSDRSVWQLCFLLVLGLRCLNVCA